MHVDQMHKTGCLPQTAYVKEESTIRQIKQELGNLRDWEGKKMEPVCTEV